MPQFVKDELNLWLGTTQEPDGCFDYSFFAPGNRWHWHNALKQGNLLQELCLVGDDAASPRVQSALGCLCGFWPDPNQGEFDGVSGWRGDPPDGIPPDSSSYQASFTVMKGMTCLDIHIFCDPEVDWQTEFETELLAEQLADGSWQGCAWGDPTLCTTWALLTLQKVAPPPPRIPFPFDLKPTSCPNPVGCRSRGVLPAAILAAMGPHQNGECVVLTVEGALFEQFGGLAIFGEDVARFQCRSR